MHCIKDQLDSRVLSKFNFPSQTNKQNVPVLFWMAIARHL